MTAVSCKPGDSSNGSGITAHLAAAAARVAADASVGRRAVAESAAAEEESAGAGASPQ